MKAQIHSFRTILIAGFIAFLAAFSLFSLAVAPDVSAQAKNRLCGGADLRLGTGSCGQQTGRVNTVIKNIVNIFTAIVGIVAVIMIIYGGFRYITSGGDSGNIQTAKSTVLYALVGLIIVALAQIIVRFVLNTARP
jgi:hypothetical protein